MTQMQGREKDRFFSFNPFPINQDGFYRTIGQKQQRAFASLAVILYFLQFFKLDSVIWIKAARGIKIATLSRYSRWIQPVFRYSIFDLNEIKQN
jgi:hypothetical protein